MEKKVIRLTETDIEGLVKKIIKEEQLSEIGGYDTPELGQQHSDSTMSAIRDRFQEISDAIIHINNMRFDILDDKLGRETIRFLKGVEPVMKRYGEAWVDTEKRRQGRN